jgi:hypothetical protein
LRFGAASRDEAQEKRVPRRSCEAATSGWFELSPGFSASIYASDMSETRLCGLSRILEA